MLIPLALIVGSAIDFSASFKAKNEIQDAIDAGVMAAAISYRSGSSADAALADGQKAFRDNCHSDACAADVLPTLTLVPGDKVSGVYQGATKTTFMRLGGISEMSFSVDAEVSLQAIFQHFYFAVDRSASLQIGAEIADRTELAAKSLPWAADQSEPNGCAFACHEINTTEPVPFYQLAVDNDIPLREDVLAEAIDLATDIILERITGTHADQVRVGAYAFSDELELLTKPTANSNNVKGKIARAAVRVWGTRFDLVLPELAREVGKSGTGLDRKSPHKTVIIATDGIWTNYKDDGVDYLTWNKKFTASWCDEFKQNGVRVVILHTKYPELTNSYWYSALNMSKLVAETESELKKCASPGFYYTGDEAPKIQAELIKMAKKVRQPQLAISK